MGDWVDGRFHLGECDENGKLHPQSPADIGE
jgi:hypothetical protein